METVPDNRKSYHAEISTQKIAHYNSYIRLKSLGDYTLKSGRVNCFWHWSAQPFLIPIPVGLVTIFSCFTAN
jgi:hypothetical protein